ncbi:LysE/ArgO family amino acid transporter [Falsirhodobacter deserti]|uniref:LysE/ArgO family amino acid transporter n=1 Tax=Falsirhodobacter deserti TaxID=1365611 RepID=UPI000FE3FD9E|nr:LysE/ArgO family amino acid transporter [Falsirhodobacter deserti]
MSAALLSGFLTSLSLILAIGSQNAFVLRQGLRREHVGTVVAICALSDAVLIATGVAGFGAAAQALPWLGQAMRWAGAVFLLVYGALRFRAAWQGGEALIPESGAPVPRRRAIMTCLLLTWANPHVYLDTLMLIGSVAAQHAPHEGAFGAGAVAASLVFFAALGYGARVLAPVFRQPRAWVVLEVVVGIIMWAIAASLVIDR